MHDSAEDPVNRLAAYQPEMELLRAMHLRGVPLIAACCGGFLLAETALFDGHNATTSWWLDAAFRKRYPHVQLDVERMIVEDGMLTTTGASTAIYTYILVIAGKAR